MRDYALGTTLYAKFTTVNASGVPTTLDVSSPPAFVRDANPTVFDSAVTITADFAGIVGLNSVSVLCTTSATGIAAGSDYALVLSTCLVSGVPLTGYVVVQWSLQKQYVNANVTAISTVPNANVTSISTIAPARITAQGIDVGAIVTAINTIADANVTSITTAVNVSALAAGVISWPTFDASTKVNGRLDTNIGTIASVTVIGSGSSASLWRGF